MFSLRFFRNVSVGFIGTAAVETSFATTAAGHLACFAMAGAAA
jgi:hypothetical protein